MPLSFPQWECAAFIVDNLFRRIREKSQSNPCFLFVRFAPVAHGVDDGDEAHAFFRKAVFHLRRYLRVFLADGLRMALRSCTER